MFLPLKSTIIIAGKVTRATELYDAETDSWVELSDVPAPFYKFSSVTFQGLPYIFGGESTKLSVARFDGNQWAMLGKIVKIKNTEH